VHADRGDRTSAGKEITTLTEEATMSRKSILKFPAAVMVAFALTLMAACADTPTEQSAAVADNVLASSTIGDPGVTDGVPLSATTVDHATVFPSTNEENIDLGWANVTWNSDDAGVGQAPLMFLQPRSFWACFEIRIDDAAPASGVNPNTNVADGMWDYRCVHGEGIAETFTAISHVDVRMAFGGEGDERFDWTRFYVMSVQSKDECRNGGWQELGFANQGHCIRYVETGRL
jgi:hypothetical protein